MYYDLILLLYNLSLHMFIYFFHSHYTIFVIFDINVHIMFIQYIRNHDLNHPLIEDII